MGAPSRFFDRTLTRSKGSGDARSIGRPATVHHRGVKHRAVKLLVRGYPDRVAGAMPSAGRGRRPDRTERIRPPVIIEGPEGTGLAVRTVDGMPLLRRKPAAKIEEWPRSTATKWLVGSPAPSNRIAPPVRPHRWAIGASHEGNPIDKMGSLSAAIISNPRRSSGARRPPAGVLTPPACRPKARKRTDWRSSWRVIQRPVARCRKGEFDVICVTVSA